MPPSPSTDPAAAGRSRRAGAARPARARFETRLTRAWLARGPLARALWPLSLVYRALVAVRRGLYRTDRRHYRNELS